MVIPGYGTRFDLGHVGGAYCSREVPRLMQVRPGVILRATATPRGRNAVSVWASNLDKQGGCRFYLMTDDMEADALSGDRILPRACYDGEIMMDVAY